MTKEVSMRRRFAVILIAIALLATTGCAVRAHTAFEINDVATSNDQVTSMANHCGSVVQPFPWSNMSALVSDMIHAELAREVAQSQNLSFSDDELRMPIENDKFGDQYKAMLADPICEQLALGLTLEQAAKESLGTDTYIEIAGQIPVAINPRFGTWNAADLTVDGSGSLSKADG